MTHPGAGVGGGASRRDDAFFLPLNSGASLGGQTARAGIWTGLGQAVAILLQFASIPILARLLNPAAFGLVATVMVLVSFGSMFVDAGLSTATIQRSNITRSQVANLFWLSGGLGLLLGVLVAAVAPLVAWGFQQPELLGITLVLSLTFPLSGFAVQPLALLRRQMRFRDITLVGLGAAFVAQAAAIAIGWTTGSYWALVAVPVVLSLTRLVLLWGVSGYRPQRLRRGVGTREMVNFGAQLTGGNLINFLARNADYAMIGWAWGPALLGYYERAYKLLLFPLQQVNGPLSAVAIPALSRLKDQPDRYRSFFRKGVWLSGTVQLPIACFALIAAEPIVLTMLGQDFAPSIEIFRAFFFASVISSTAPATSWVFMSWGHGDRFLRMVFVNTTVVLLVFGLALPYGVVAMAWAFSLCQLVLRLPSILYCFQPTPLRLADVLKPLAGVAAACAAAMLAAWVVVTRLVHPLEASPLAQMLTAAAVFFSVYTVGWLMLHGGRRGLRDLVGTVRR